MTHRDGMGRAVGGGFRIGSRYCRGRRRREEINGPAAGVDHWKGTKQLRHNMQLQERTKLLHLSLYVLTPKRHLFWDIQRKNELDPQGSLIESSISGIQVNKQHLELDMEQWTGSKLGKDLPGRASPSPSQLLAFAPAKEQAAGVWAT